MISKEHCGLAITFVLALGIVPLTGHAGDNFARSWMEGSDRYVEITHGGHDLAQGSQVGAAKCRKNLGSDKLAAHSAGQLSHASFQTLSELIGVRVRISGMQRDTKKLAAGGFRTRCHAADKNISASLNTEPSRADLARARLYAGVEKIASSRYREGIEILQKLRGEANYQSALPAIVAGLVNIDVSLASETDERYVRLAGADYRPALVEYRDASSEAGWEKRVRQAQRRLNDLTLADARD